MRTTWVLLHAVTIAACSTQDRSGALVSCGRGSLNEADFARGEVLLPEHDVVKVSLADQEGMTARSDGRLFFPASDSDVLSYSLKRTGGHEWFVALTGGLAGREYRTAQRNFYDNVPVNATYYPATKKLSVWTTVPHVEGSKAFPLWVFVRAPDDVSEIRYDCGAFD